MGCDWRIDCGVLGTGDNDSVGLGVGIGYGSLRYQDSHYGAKSGSFPEEKSRSKRSFLEYSLADGGDQGATEIKRTLLWSWLK